MIPNKIEAVVQCCFQDLLMVSWTLLLHDELCENRIITLTTVIY